MKYILNIDEMEMIKGGNIASNFCAGFAAGEVIYGIGVLANIWNPVGWAGTVTMLAIDAGCAYVSLR